MTTQETTLIDCNAQPQCRATLVAEFALLFLAAPAFFYFHATRWGIHLALWCIALYGLFLLRRSKDFSWRKLWHGQGWPKAQRKMALARWVISSAAVIILAQFIAPERLFTFPMLRPWFWLLVMVLYPVLSCVPQELIFRSFMFHRYAPLFRDVRLRAGITALVFSFAHVVFHNPVSPFLCLIGGAFMGQSYIHHRSLKWAAVEHAAYGCMVFTVGLGGYFLVGGWRV